MESGVVDLRHHKVAARIGGNRGGAIVGEIHIQARRDGGDGGGARAAIEGGRGKTTEGDGSGWLVECLLRAQSDRFDLDKFRRGSIHATVLPTRAVAGIDHQLDAVDSGEADTVGGKRQPGAAGAYPCAGGPDAGIKIRKELQRDGILRRSYQIHGTQAVKWKATEHICRARAHSRAGGGEDSANIAIGCADQGPIGGSGRGDDVNRACHQSRGINRCRIWRTTHDGSSTQHRRLHTDIICQSPRR